MSISNLFAENLKIDQDLKVNSIELYSEGDGNQLNYYNSFVEQGAQFDSAGRVFDSPQSADVFITRVGNMCTMTVKRIFASANTPSDVFYRKDDALPERFRPAENISGFVRAVDNNVFSSGMCILTTGGVLNIYKDATGSTNWNGSASDDNGHYSFTLSWHI